MRLPLSWLKEHVSLSGLSPARIADVFTLSGSEVETVRASSAKQFDHMFVGEIRTIIQHPSADKLKITKVRVKKGRVRTIVCGAPNIKVGQKVPVALPGAVLPSGQIIEALPIRGVRSEGMLLSAKELGISDDHSGIYVLGNEVTAGETLGTALGMHDTVFELDITPNRGDCLSVRGLGRELSANTGKPMKRIAARVTDLTGRNVNALHVRVREPRLCTRYGAYYLRGVRVTESPQWLKNRLVQMGTRPINSVVDATNYVMYALGQPMHAFDAGKVEDGGSGARKTIIVRRAHKGEKLRTLDGEERMLKTSMLVIANRSRALAVAGVMGGSESAVTQKTKDIILEAAVFHPASVRRTSKQLGLASESSYRFERGVDPLSVEEALKTAAGLIITSGGEGAPTGTPIIVDAHAFVPATVRINFEHVRNLLGAEASDKKILGILRLLGFEAGQVHAGTAIVRVPSWRNDVRIEADVAEEVGRLLGYNRFKRTVPQGAIPPRHPHKMLEFVDSLKDGFVDERFIEVHTYSFYGDAHVQKSGMHTEGHLAVHNPMNPDQQYLRLSLLPRLFEAVQRNAQERDRVALFEIGTVFGETRGGRRELPQESLKCAAILGTKKGALVSTRENVFVLLRSGLIGALAHAGVPEASIKMEADAHLLGGSRGAVLRIGKQRAGVLGIASGGLARSWKLPEDTAFFECDVRAILAARMPRARYVPIPRTPDAKRDLAIVVSTKIPYEELQNALVNATSLLRSITLFDVYEGAKLGKGKRSLAFHLMFGHSERTLENKEVDSLLLEITRMLTQRFGAEIR